uniref:Uncharacterized protein n=1 Tax=Tetranychus urticae TaxID=32264 RepID=T1KV45_TETUR
MALDTGDGVTEKGPDCSNVDAAVDRAEVDKEFANSDCIDAAGWTCNDGVDGNVGDEGKADLIKSSGVSCWICSAVNEDKSVDREDEDNAEGTIKVCGGLLSGVTILPDLRSVESLLSFCKLRSPNEDVCKCGSKTEEESESEDESADAVAIAFPAPIAKSVAVKGKFSPELTSVPVGICFESFDVRAGLDGETEDVCAAPVLNVGNFWICSADREDKPVVEDEMNVEGEDEDAVDVGEVVTLFRCCEAPESNGKESESVDDNPAAIAVADRGEYVSRLISIILGICLLSSGLDFDTELPTLNDVEDEDRSVEEDEEEERAGVGNALKNDCKRVEASEESESASEDESADADASAVPVVIAVPAAAAIAVADRGKSASKLAPELIVVCFGSLVFGCVVKESKIADEAKDEDFAFVLGDAVSDLICSSESHDEAVKLEVGGEVEWVELDDEGAVGLFLLLSLLCSMIGAELSCEVVESDDKSVKEVKEDVVDDGLEIKGLTDSPLMEDSGIDLKPIEGEGEVLEGAVEGLEDEVVVIKDDTEGEDESDEDSVAVETSGVDDVKEDDGVVVAEGGDFIDEVDLDKDEGKIGVCEGLLNDPTMAALETRDEAECSDAGWVVGVGLTERAEFACELLFCEILARCQDSTEAEANAEVVKESVNSGCIDAAGWTCSDGVDGDVEDAGKTDLTKSSGVSCWICSAVNEDKSVDRDEEDNAAGVIKVCVGFLSGVTILPDFRSDECKSGSKTEEESESEDESADAVAIADPAPIAALVATKGKFSPELTSVPVGNCFESLVFGGVVKESKLANETKDEDFAFGLGDAVSDLICSSESDDEAVKFKVDGDVEWAELDDEGEGLVFAVGLFLLLSLFCPMIGAELSSEVVLSLRFCGCVNLSKSSVLIFCIRAVEREDKSVGEDGWIGVCTGLTDCLTISDDSSVDSSDDNAAAIAASEAVTDRGKCVPELSAELLDICFESFVVDGKVKKAELDDETDDDSVSELTVGLPLFCLILGTKLSCEVVESDDKSVKAVKEDVVVDEVDEDNDFDEGKIGVCESLFNAEIKDDPEVEDESDEDSDSVADKGTLVFPFIRGLFAVVIGEPRLEDDNAAKDKAAEFIRLFEVDGEVETTEVDADKEDGEDEVGLLVFIGVEREDESVEEDEDEDGIEGNVNKGIVTEDFTGLVCSLVFCSTCAGIFNAPLLPRSTIEFLFWLSLSCWKKELFTFGTLDELDELNETEEDSDFAEAESEEEESSEKMELKGDDATDEEMLSCKNFPEFCSCCRALIVSSLGNFCCGLCPKEREEPGKEDAELNEDEEDNEDAPEFTFGTLVPCFGPVSCVVADTNPEKSKGNSENEVDSVDEDDVDSDEDFKVSKGVDNFCPPFTFDELEDAPEDELEAEVDAKLLTFGLTSKPFELSPK